MFLSHGTRGLVHVKHYITVISEYSLGSHIPHLYYFNSDLIKWSIYQTWISFYTFLLSSLNVMNIFPSVSLSTLEHQTLEHIFEHV